MELFVPNHELANVQALLASENVSYTVTDKTFTLTLAGKEAYEVTAVQAELLETDVPTILDESPPKNTRAFRLPSGRRFIITDLDGNYERTVVVPPGWER